MDIKQKIAALLAKARGTDNEHEAELFMAKALEMLEQHQIAMGDLIDGDDPVKHSPGLDAAGRGLPSWHRHLFRALGHLYGCYSVRYHTYFNNKDSWRQELVGRESAIETTMQMFPFVKDECHRLGRRLAKLSGQTPAYEARRIANALEVRIWRMIKPPDDAPKTAAAKNALVTVDRVKQVVEQHYGKLRDSKRSSRSTHTLAQELANGIGLHRQTGSAQALRIGRN